MASLQDLIDDADTALDEASEKIERSIRAASAAGAEVERERLKRWCDYALSKVASAHAKVAITANALGRHDEVLACASAVNAIDMLRGVLFGNWQAGDKPAGVEMSSASVVPEGGRVYLMMTTRGPAV